MNVMSTVEFICFIVLLFVAGLILEIWLHSAIIDCIGVHPIKNLILGCFNWHVHKYQKPLCYHASEIHCCQFCGKKIVKSGKILYIMPLKDAIGKNIDRGVSVFPGDNFGI